MKTLTEEKINKIRKYPKKYNWYKLCKEYKLEEKFLIEFQNYVEWNTICVNQNLSFDFIYKFRHMINFFTICYNKNFKLTEKEIEIILIDTKLTRADWTNFSFYYKLSENFINKYKDKVYWANLFEQRSFEDFSKDFMDKNYQFLHRSTMKNEKFNTFLKEHGYLKPPNYLKTP